MVLAAPPKFRAPAGLEARGSRSFKARPPGCPGRGAWRRCPGPG